MLISLQIENFALIDHLELNFGSGLNVLTGETGAGKSIILDALDAALGGKTTGRAIRTGADKGSVEAHFGLEPDLRAWLIEQDIDLLEEADEETLVCTRELTAGRGGVRSRSRVNGVLVNKQQMESLRDRLVEITAQGQTVQLGQPALQREWLDGFGGAALLQQRDRVAIAHQAFQQTHQALEKRRRHEEQRLQQLDLFEFQARELQEAALTDADELDQLEQERKRLSHAVELQQQSYEVYQALYANDAGEDACADLLGKAQSILQEMVDYDTQIQPILELVSGALTQVEEAGREINAYGEDLETDPDRLQEVEARIVKLKQICKKYGPTLAEAIALSQRLQSELEMLSDGGQSLEVLEKAYQERQAELTAACAELTQLRQTAAQQLEAMLVSELKPLAMEKVQFTVQITPCAPTALGADQTVFMFSPNPGEPLQPLAEIASGGEMSRFLLALKVCLSQVDLIGTMVFDEIDTGVSGRVAQAIAEKLHQLSRRHQVLCVTHQPIIAAMADNHFRVDKQVIGEAPAAQSKKRSADDSEAAAATLDAADERTVVRVSALDTQQRREELAQLAGGKSHQEAIAFAESLLVEAANSRTSLSATSSPSSPAPVSANAETSASTSTGGGKRKSTRSKK